MKIWTGRGTLQFWLGVIILLGFAVFVQAYYGWSAVWAPWQTVSPLLLAAALAATVVSYLLRALRLYDYFHASVRGRYALTLRLTLEHNLLNNLLPMRTGELSFPLLMTRYFAVPTTQALTGLLWFRVLDLWVLGLVSVALLLAPWPLLAWIAALGWLALLLMARPLLGTLRERVGRRPPGPWQARALVACDALPVETRAYRRAIAWTVLNWAVKLAVLAWVITWFVPASMAAACSGAIGGDLSSVLPFHGVAGVGTYEAGVVAGLALHGITPSAALVAALNVHLFLLFGTVLGGAGALFLGGRRG